MNTVLYHRLIYHLFIEQPLFISIRYNRPTFKNVVNKIFRKDKFHEMVITYAISFYFRFIVITSIIKVYFKIVFQVGIGRRFTLLYLFR